MEQLKVKIFQDTDNIIIDTVDSRPGYNIKACRKRIFEFKEINSRFIDDGCIIWDYR